jgi:hypothetical protein
MAYFLFCRKESIEEHKTRGSLRSEASRRSRRLAKTQVPEFRKKLHQRLNYPKYYPPRYKRSKQISIAKFKEEDHKRK